MTSRRSHYPRNGSGVSDLIDRAPACPDAPRELLANHVPEIDSRAGRSVNEGGWALLGMILALTIISIMLAGVVPSVQMEVKRDKEEEMIFRGNEMAEAIARYYNIGRLGPINLSIPPPYGYLYDLSKLRDGVELGATKIKFVRPSALLDPMVSRDWVPVRARDPRLMPLLQAWAGMNMTAIPPSYLILAAPPIKMHAVSPGDGSNPNQTPGTGTLVPQGGNGSMQPGAQAGVGGVPQTGGVDADGNPIDGTSGQMQVLPVQPGGTTQRPQTGARNGQQTNQADDDDDDDDDTADPLSNLIQADKGSLPIVGVAPNLKSASVRALWGLQKYSDWVFIYVPGQPVGVPMGTQPINPPNRNGSGPPRGGLRNP